MTKWDLSALEQQISDLQDLVAKVTEVNAAQAEQLRKAQERIRAAEAERDHAWNMVAKADADAVRCAAQSLDDKIRANAAKAREVRAWNEAIEAAAQVASQKGEGYSPQDLGYSWGRADASLQIAAAIHSLAKEAGNEP
jgi:GAF domain-containing protein